MTDGRGGFRVGHIVRTKDGVRPKRYAGKQGAIAEVRSVVPRSVVKAFHAEGKTTANGDYEIGIDFSGPGATRELQTDAWFLVSEITPVVAISERPTRNRTTT